MQITPGLLVRAPGRSSSHVGHAIYPPVSGRPTIITTCDPYVETVARRFRSSRWLVSNVALRLLGPLLGYDWAHQADLRPTVQAVSVTLHSITPYSPSAPVEDRPSHTIESSNRKHFRVASLLHSPHLRPAPIIFHNPLHTTAHTRATAGFFDSRDRCQYRPYRPVVLAPCRTSIDNRPVPVRQK